MAKEITARARLVADRLDLQTNAKFEGVSVEEAMLLRQLSDEVERLREVERIVVELCGMCAAAGVTSPLAARPT
ncbi:Rho-associated kinase, putative [Ancylobacter novellus DSM 506]|uniref:Rho-associated kinase, putative n=1 Tax=Ancylobacter novellus (strain ATCC 8093 / DSM 506 / JCM 20403 / CCM 1077 / IAM 12100 / NBRC 12443 / NCIMB 10456) TaxID=639283 RepID=D7A2U8_ANCN5|nr:hypothetical protein [Ancylobacter novellus]ADH91628.1 Rho-associated kinase, putative [Ancylobacter novellus DSM 506]